MPLLLRSVSAVPITFARLAIALGLVAASCAQSKVDAPVASTTAAVTAAATGTSPGNLDVLFMIDNSSSMTVMQEKLAAQIPGFMTALQNLPTGLPNLHIAVVSSDMGAPGDSTASIGCTTDGDQGSSGSEPRAASLPSSISGLDGGASGGAPGGDDAGAPGCARRQPEQRRDVHLQRRRGRQLHRRPLHAAVVHDRPRRPGLWLREPAGLHLAGARRRRLSGARVERRLPAPRRPAGHHRPQQRGRLLGAGEHRALLAQRRPAEHQQSSGADRQLSLQPVRPPLRRSGRFGVDLPHGAAAPTAGRRADDGLGADAEPDRLRVRRQPRVAHLRQQLRERNQGAQGRSRQSDRRRRDRGASDPLHRRLASGVGRSGHRCPASSGRWSSTPAVRRAATTSIRRDQTTTDGSFGDPAVRIAQWVQAFGANGVMASICDGSYANAFSAIVSKIGAHLPGGSGSVSGSLGGTRRCGRASGLPERHRSRPRCRRRRWHGGSSGNSNSGLQNGGCDVAAARPTAASLGALLLFLLVSLVVVRRRRVSARRSSVR